MLFQIVSFLLDVAAGLLGGACLLRMYMRYQGISFRNPVGSFLCALTDWLVVPLRRVIPATSRVDMASLVGAYLIQLAQFGILFLLTGAERGLALLPLLALFGLVRIAISGLMGMLIVYAILSWVQAESPLSDVIGQLCAPLLRPLRRVIPLLGGIDLSPLVLLVLLQVALIVLGNVQASLLR